MTGHTLGPWRMEDRNGADILVAGMGYELAELFIPYPGVEGVDEGAANARLIAAAPDLLEAASAILDAFDVAEIFLPDNLYERLHDAMRKAEGKE